MTTERQPDLTLMGETRILAFWEIVSLGLSAIVALWATTAVTENRAVLLFPIVTAFVFVVMSQSIRCESLRDLGFRMDNLSHALRLLAVPMTTGIAILLILGWYMDSLRLALPADRLNLLWLPLAGLAWGLLQQFLLQSFVNRRAQIVWGGGAASIVVVALVFALFHLPNAWLAVATFVSGLVWAAVFQKAPNLYALALSHAVMTWVMISAISDDALQGLRVGFHVFRL